MRKIKAKTPEGKKILELLEVKEDWELSRFKGHDWTTHHFCIKHKKSNLRIVPYIGMFLGLWIVIAIDVNYYDDKFLSKEDHRTIAPMAIKMIEEFKLENKELTKAIMEAQSSRCTSSTT